MEEKTRNMLIEKGVSLEGTLECLNQNEMLYLKLLWMFLEDEDFQVLEDSMRNHRIKEAFDSGHALKGLAGNLGLSIIYQKLCELVDCYRAGNEADFAQYVEIKDLCNEIESIIQQEPSV